MEQIYGDLNGIRDVVQRLDAPMTEQNVRIVLAIINTVDLIKENLQKIQTGDSAEEPQIEIGDITQLPIPDPEEENTDADT